MSSLISFFYNCSTVLNKKEFLKIVSETFWAEDENTIACLSFCKYLYVFCSKIHTKLSPNKFWIIAKEDPS